MSPLVFWEIVDFPKHLQNIDNVLPYKCVANLYNPRVYHNKKRPVRALFIVVGAHSIPSVSRINARRLRGNRNDLIAHGLSNLLVVEPATALRVSSRGHEPKIKPAQGRFDFWLGRTDSNHDKENQNLLSYH